MTCKNCNNTLSGTEDYCPYCGTSQKEIEIKAIPCEEKTDTAKAPESSIFQSEPVYIYTEPPKEKKDTKTKVQPKKKAATTKKAPAKISKNLPKNFLSSFLFSTLIASFMIAPPHTQKCPLPGLQIPWQS